MKNREVASPQKVGEGGGKDFWPHIIPLCCLGIYEVFSGIKKCTIGQQTNIGNTAVYVMPSTSGLVAQYPSRKDKLIFFNELKQLRDTLKQQCPVYVT